MRSRAELRRVLEWVLRTVLVVTLATALWRSLRGASARAATLSADVERLGPALRQATREPDVDALSVSVNETISPEQRAWLVALRRVGVDVRWQGSPPALALTAERAREPVAPVRVQLAADSDGGIAVADSLGVIDTLHVLDGGASLEAADLVGSVRAERGTFSASVPVPPRSERRAVLVLGRAGWESRFVLAALSEAGWTVRARLPAAPGVAVSDAALLPIDTSRYDAVVALDSSAADLAPAVTRFVAQGGGLLAAGTATGLGAWREALPARATERRPGRILLGSETLTQADLPLRPLASLRGDAVPLERQPAGLASAIRRAGRGRVAAIGYDESWRWRMQGGAAGEAAHRAWWSRMVGLVAPERSAPQVAAASESSSADERIAPHAASVTASAGERGKAAPRVALFDALGPPSATAATGPRPSSPRLPRYLLLIIALALLAESASRRFRGAS